MTAGLPDAHVADVVVFWSLTRTVISNVPPVRNVCFIMVLVLHDDAEVPSPKSYTKNNRSPSVSHDCDASIVMAERTMKHEKCVRKIRSGKISFGLTEILGKACATA
jgi:hypothetical protein